VAEFHGKRKGKRISSEKGGRKGTDYEVFRKSFEDKRAKRGPRREKKSLHQRKKNFSRKRRGIGSRKGFV